MLTDLRLLAYVGLLAFTLGPVAAEAQAPARISDPVPLTGVVVDDASGAPIPGALVLLNDRAEGIFSDERGRFRFEEVRPGTQSMIVRQLGYDTLWTEIEVRPEPEPLTLRLAPDPVMLERITAVVDRLRARRNRIGTSVRVIDRMALQQTDAFDVMDLIRRRTALTVDRCPGIFSMAPCARVRGRLTQVEVYVDGSRIVGGLAVLADYRPQELYTVEVIGGGRSIRVYTNWFMETVAAGRRIPTGYLF